MCLQWLEDQRESPQVVVGSWPPPMGYMCKRKRTAELSNRPQSVLGSTREVWSQQLTVGIWPYTAGVMDSVSACVLCPWLSGPTAGESWPHTPGCVSLLGLDVCWSEATCVGQCLLVMGSLAFPRSESSPQLRVSTQLSFCWSGGRTAETEHAAAW